MIYEYMISFNNQYMARGWKRDSIGIELSNKPNHIKLANNVDKNSRVYYTEVNPYTFTRD